MNSKKSIKTLLRMTGLVKPLVLQMISAILLGVIGHLQAISISVLGAFALISILGYGAFAPLQTIFTMLLAFALLRGVFHYGEQQLNHYIAFKLLALIRDRVFTSLRKLAPAKLEGRDKGDLISLITSDVELLEVFYAHTISPVFIALFVSLIMVLFIGSQHVLLGLLALLAYLTLGVFIPLASANATHAIGADYRSKFGELGSYFLDSLRGISEIIQYGTGKKRLEQIDAQTDRLNDINGVLKVKGARYMGTSEFAISLFALLMLMAGVALNLPGHVVVLTTVALLSSFGPVMALSNLGAGLSETVASAGRVLAILDESPIVDSVDDGVDVAFKDAKLSEVSFGYGDELILDNFSMDVSSGQVIGVVGPSGSGKSTMLKLLMRFWDRDSGEIKISNEDIKAINTDSLRDNQGFLTQESSLFSDTIENNVKVGKLDATREEVERACQKASIHDFIVGLPDGYDTQIGELGDRLSGGEKQRIGLARAFLHDAPLLLLDEPTSNLDSLNEGVILKSLAQDDARTTIIVSHRQSTVGIADQTITVRPTRKS